MQTKQAYTGMTSDMTEIAEE